MGAAGEDGLARNVFWFLANFCGKRDKFQTFVSLCLRGDRHVMTNHKDTKAQRTIQINFVHIDVGDATLFVLSSYAMAGGGEQRNCRFIGRIKGWGDYNIDLQHNRKWYNN
jgi:hypothetical protein